MGQRILIVDDDDAVRVTLAANLELDGYEVREASSAAGALAMLDQHGADVVLADIRMPGGSGIELYRAIRARKSDVPVVLMTAFTVEELVREAIDEGVFTVLTKPFDIEAASAVLSRALDAPLVLVVDDHQEDATALVAALRSAGLKAEAARSGEEAIAIVHRGGVGVCVTDLVMPGMDGVAVARAIKAIDREIVVIVLSGYDASAMMRSAAAGGVEGCMRKPVSPREVIRSIAGARAGRTRRAGRK